MTRIEFERRLQMDRERELQRQLEAQHERNIMNAATVDSDGVIIPASSQKHIKNKQSVLTVIESSDNHMNDNVRRKYEDSLEIERDEEKAEEYITPGGDPHIDLNEDEDGDSSDDEDESGQTSDDSYEQRQGKTKRVGVNKICVSVFVCLCACVCIFYTHCLCIVCVCVFVCVM